MPPYAAVTWSAGDELTSAKLAQMSTNIGEHDHRFAGDRGAPIGRVATGTTSITPVANTGTAVRVNYPADVFDPAGPIPVPIANPEASATGGTIEAWGTRSHDATGFSIYVIRSNTTVTSFSWVAIQAPA